MARIVLEEAQDFAVLPENSIVLCKIEDVELREVNGNRGTWRKLEFKFKILTVQVVGDGSSLDGFDMLVGSPIWGSVPFKLTDNPENRLRQWIEAIYGMELSVGFELDTDLLLGKQVRAVTSTYERKQRVDRSGAPQLQHAVEALLPVKGGVPSRAAVATPAPQPQSGGLWNAPPATTSQANWNDEPPF